ncbi:MAG TPA: hypothetical protein VJ840_07490 [Gemmatimonadaceae bacterium]|nr:hypothetical protein [Gemmatimonadaceae bacterium]
MRKVVVVFGLVVSSLAYAGFASAQQPTASQRFNSDSAGNINVRFYFSPIRVDSGYRLTPNSYSGTTHVEQTVNFSDRADPTRVALTAGAGSRSIDTWNAIEFVSPQLAGPFELSGSFSGRLDLITNKPHFDFQISLYELTSSGDYNLVSLYSTQPARTDLSQNTPLQTGVRQNLDYATDSRTSRTIQNGSRLVVLISILKEPNGATGDAGLDANELLRIRWYGESYIELHVRRR